MKITSVEISAISDGRRAEPLIVLRTDSAQSGIAGIPLDGLQDGVEPLTSALAALMIGRDPFDIQALGRDAGAWAGHTPFAASVVAAASTAMADITGQELGVPVHQLLGGRVRDRVRACAIAWAHEASGIDAIRSAAREVVGMGYTALRVEPFSGSSKVEPGNLSGAHEVVRAIRDALPDEIDLVVDGSAVVDVDDARAFAELLDPLEVLWVEQPTHNLPLEVLDDIGHHLTTPIAAARNTSDVRLHRLLMAGTVDHVVVDVGLTGGLLAARRIAALAEVHHIGIVPTGEGPASLATALHLAAAIPNLTMVEMRPGLVTVEDGTVVLDLRPGLGLEQERVSAQIAS